MPCRQQPWTTLTPTTLLLLLLAATTGMAHEGRDDAADTHGNAGPAMAMDSGLLAAIGEDYQANVEPIFAEKCAPCHGTAEALPWYHALPGVGSLIDSDIAEAREHLDMREGFPFRGHGAPEEDLDAIEDTLREGTMPPLRYRVMHWDSQLEAHEVDAIMAWIEEARGRLNP